MNVMPDIDGRDYDDVYPPDYGKMQREARRVREEKDNAIRLEMANTPIKRLTADQYRLIFYEEVKPLVALRVGNAAGVPPLGNGIEAYHVFTLVPWNGASMVYDINLMRAASPG